MEAMEVDATTTKRGHGSKETSKVVKEVSEEPSKEAVLALLAHFPSFPRSDLRWAESFALPGSQARRQRDFLEAPVRATLPHVEHSQPPSLRSTSVWPFALAGLALPLTFAFFALFLPPRGPGSRTGSPCASMAS